MSIRRDVLMALSAAVLCAVIYFAPSPTLVFGLDSRMRRPTELEAPGAEDSRNPSNTTFDARSGDAS